MFAYYKGITASLNTEQWFTIHIKHFASNTQGEVIMIGFILNRVAPLVLIHVSKPITIESHLCLTIKYIVFSQNSVNFLTISISLLLYDIASAQWDYDDKIKRTHT